MADDPLEAASSALSDFANGPVAQSAATIQSTIDRTFTAMEHSVAKAVVAGKLSFADLVASVLSDFDRLATRQYLTQPLEGLFSQIVTAVMPVAGARAAGGPVEAGSSYLVGENGPELFTPAQSGAITATPSANAAPITVNVTTPDAASFLKSEGQLTAMLSRALIRGQRNL